MKTLTRQEIRDILYGCAVVGTGGGGDLATGLAMMDRDLDDGKQLTMITLEELADDAYVATPYGCGAPRSEGAAEDEAFRGLPRLDDSAAGLAYTCLENYMNKTFTAVASTELGGENTAEALHIACQLGRPIVDADPAGRSVPELQHSTFFIKGLPIGPVGVATNFGETIVLDHLPNDFRAEAIIRAIAVASGDEVGVTDHPITGAQFKSAIIPGAISFAQRIGEILRTTKSTAPEADRGACVARAIAEGEGGAVLFRGRITETPWETTGGFNIGEIHLKGTHEYEGQTFRLAFKNEVMAAWRNDKPVAMIPDLVCMIDEEGDPFTIPNFRDGMELNILALPAPEIWTTPEGMSVFGPKAMGYDLEYVPFER